MSAADDRLRRTVAAVFARPDDAIAVGYGDVVAALALIDDLRRENDRVAQEARDISAHDRGLMGEQIARADAAEAELARLTTERDAARAEAAGLRAIVEGRTVPTPDDAAAHALAHPLPTPGAASNGATCDEPIGLWLCVVDGEGAAVLRLAHESDDQGPYLMAWSSDYGWCGTGDIRRAWPLDASGRPCPWPTVAAEAATGAALAGEGR